MRKFKKAIGAIFLVFGIISGFMTCNYNAETCKFDVPATSSTTEAVFSNEQINEIKKYIQEEFQKLRAQKTTSEAQEEVAKLREEVSTQKKKVRIYKDKLEAKKYYVSPQEVQVIVDKEKAALVIEFIKYLTEFVNSAENKEKKLKHVDLTKMFQKFINLSLSITFTNPGEVTVAQSAIQGKAR